MNRTAEESPGAGSGRGDRPGFAAPVLTLASSLLLLLPLGSCAYNERDLPVYWTVPEFALVHQQGDTLRTADLRGAYWVASFVFTNCTSVCPLITQRMAALRDGLAAEGLLGNEVRLVSITVDPARDTPEVLREYAGRFGGISPRGVGLPHPRASGGGPDHDSGGLQAHRVRPLGARARGRRLPGHAFATAGPVDASGQVRGLYDTREPDAIERLRADLRALLE